MWDISSLISDNNQWEKFDLNDSQQRITRNKIIRFANYSCQKLFEIDESKVLFSNYSKDSDFFIVHLTDLKQAQNLYGFYNYYTPSFYPIEEDYAKVFELISFLSDGDYKKGLASTLDKLRISYQTYIKTSKESIFIVNSNDIISDHFLPVHNWDYYDKENTIHYDNIIEYIKEEYNYIFNDNKDFDLQLWVASLSFSKTYNLVEVGFNHNFQNKRFYLIFDFNWADPFNFRSSIIDGSSDFIHNVWSNQTEKTGKDFTIETEQDVREYVKFFCWAVEGDEGHFILPINIIEMPWASRPNQINLKQIESNDYKISKTGEADDIIYSIKNVQVVYGKAIFKAEFSLPTKNGYIAMVDDEPIEAELPFKCQHFLKFEEPISKVDEFAQSEELLDKELFIDETWKTREEKIEIIQEIGAKKLIKLLKSDHLIENTLVNKEVYINDFKNSSRPIEIKNCIFNEDVHFVTNESINKFMFTNCIFKKTLNATNVNFQNSLEFNGCDFKGELTYGSTSINFKDFCGKGLLIFVRCNFFGLVDMSNMTLYGDLTFMGCTFSSHVEHIFKIYSKYENKRYKNEDLLLEGKKSVQFISNDFDFNLYDSKLLVLNNSTLNGNLTISGSDIDKQIKLCTFFGGALNAKGIEVRGEVAIYDSFFNDYIELANSKFQQTIKFFNNQHQWDGTEWLIKNNQTKTMGYVSFDNSDIAGNLEMRNMDVKGDISLYGVYIDVYLDVFGMKCESLDLKFSEIKGGLYAYRRDLLLLNRKALLIEKDLDISSSTINIVRIEGIEVKGKVIAKTGNFNYLKISTGWGPTEDLTSIQPVHSSVSEIDFKSLKIEGDLNLSGIITDFGLKVNYTFVKGSVLFFDKNVFITMLEDIEYSEQSQIVILPTKENQPETQKQKNGHEKFEDIAFKWLQNNKSRIGNKSSIPSANILRSSSLNLNSIHVGGNLELLNIEVFANIELDYTSINQNINISGFCRKMGEFQATVPKFETICKNFTMKRIRVNGDVELSGIEIDSINGNGFIASGATIKGGMYLIADKKGNFNNLNSDNIKYSAKIKGDFDVSVSEIKELSFSEINFRYKIKEKKKNKTSPKDDAGIVNIINLERTVLDKFRIVHPTPQDIVLNGINVNQWDFGNKNLEYMNKDQNQYLEVFDKMKDFDKSVYIDVETKLRNSNEDKEADKIYIAMRKKARNLNSKSWPLTKKVWDVILGVSTKYGTNFWRLLWIWFGLVTVLSLIFVLFNVHVKTIQSIGPLNYFEAPLFALQNCIPLLDIKLIEGDIVHIGFKWLTLICTIISYALLSIAIFGLSAKVSRVK
ncbi:MAG: hypothetical protein R2797_10800 [Gelidibacter sp.]